MPQENIRIKLGSLKKDSELSINGFTIRKQGNLWVVKKGDFYSRSFSENELNKLAEKLSAQVVQEVTQEPATMEQPRKAKRLAKKLQRKHDEELARLAHEKEVAAKREARKNRPFRRNRPGLEFFDVLIQAVAYATWLAYFFTDIIQTYLAEKTPLAVVGVAFFALMFHIVYVRQLGRKHRIVNALTGFVNLLLAVAALTLYFGPISHTDLTLDQILPSLEITMQTIEAQSLIAFLFVKWVLTIFIKKK